MTCLLLFSWPLFSILKYFVVDIFRITSQRSSKSDTSAEETCNGRAVRGARERKVRPAAQVKMPVVILFVILFKLTLKLLKTL